MEKQLINRLQNDIGKSNESNIYSITGNKSERDLLLKTLKEKNISQDLYVFEKIIKPKYFKRDRNLLEMFLAEILGDISTDSIYDNFSKKYHAVTKLLSYDFTADEDYYKHIEYNNGIIQLNQLHNIKTAVKDLAKEYLLQKNRNEKYLLICIDDIVSYDIELTYELIKQIELYFMDRDTNILIILNYDEKDFIETLNLHYFKQNKVLLENKSIDKEYVKRMSYNFYQELIPIRNRINHEI